jgi:hypothetical protein
MSVKLGKSLNVTAIQTAILQAAVNAEPGLTLFKNTTIGGRPLGDIDNSGTVTSFDSLQYGKWDANTLTDAAYLSWINDTMNPYILSNPTTYADYLTGGFTSAPGIIYSDTSKSDSGTLRKLAEKSFGTGAGTLNAPAATIDFRIPAPLMPCAVVVYEADYWIWYVSPPENIPPSFYFGAIGGNFLQRGKTTTPVAGETSDQGNYLKGTFNWGDRGGPHIVTVIVLG